MTERICTSTRIQKKIKNSKNMTRQLKQDIACWPLHGRQPVSKQLWLSS